MYLGILKRIRAAGEVVKIEARVVYAEDSFDFEYGDNPHIRHIPAMKAENGPVVAVYAIVTFRDGSKQHEVMSAHEVLAIRDRSKGFDPQKPNASPWGTDFGEMAKKTVLKRLGKILPQARGRAVLSGDADDSGAEEEVDIFPELGTPEPQERVAANPAPAIEAKANPAPAAKSDEATSRIEDVDTTLPRQGQKAETVLTERKIDGEKQGATEADEVVFWKTQLRKLRKGLFDATTIQEAEDAYSDWNAEYETIPADVEFEVARLCTRRVDQIKASFKGPSDYQKMKDAEADIADAKLAGKEDSPEDYKKATEGA
jgi:hypothetical protein